MLNWFKRKLFSWYDFDMGLGWNLSNLWGELTHPFTGTWHWLIKSIQYSALLWNDFDWDFNYILIILRYKIRRTRKRIVDNDLVVSASQQAAEMLHVETLITKYLENDFCKEELEAHDKKWGKTELETVPSDLGKGFRELILSRPNANTEEKKKQEEKEFMALLEKQNEEKEECWKEIFNSMRDNMQGWWD